MSVLHDIINANGSIERFREVLRAGADTNSQDEMGYTPLHAAVVLCSKYPQETDKMVLFVRSLKRYEANVNLGSNEGFTPLHLAVMFRNYKMIAMLLRVKSDPNSLDKDAYTALHHACTTGSAEAIVNNKTDLRVVKLLLRYKPLVDMENWSNETPLMFAVRNNNYEIVRELLNSGASVNKADTEGNTAMHHAIYFKVDLSIIEELTRYGAVFDSINKDDKNPIVIFFEGLPDNPTHADVEYAKKVIRLPLLKGYELGAFERKRIIEIYRANKDSNLIRFLDLCYYEAVKIFSDNLAMNFTAHKVIFRFMQLKNNGSGYFVPYEVYDKLIKKFVKCKYPAYSDVIVNSFGRHYMKQRFAQMCSDIVTNIPIFEFSALLSISEYLTNVQMLLMILALYEKRPYINVSRSVRSAYCTLL